MKVFKMLTPPIKAVVILFAAQAVFAADGTWIWREGVGTGGTDWTEWSDAENWVDGVVADEGGIAKLGGATNQYITLPSMLSVKYVAGQSKGHPVLRGDGTLAITALNANNSSCYLYSDFTYDATTEYAGWSGVQICGDLKGCSGKAPLFQGSNYFRYDLYAPETGESRSVEGKFASNWDVRLNAGSSLYFIAPHGSPTNILAKWNQTEGSPFLRRADGQAEHVLSVGTVVTGADIPDGTFLKRVFPDGTIELSAAAASTVEGNELTFAAFTPHLRVHAYRLGAFNTTGAHTIYVEKYRPEDDFVVQTFLQPLTKPQINSNHTVTVREGYYPGRLELTSDAGIRSDLTLKNCNLGIAGDLNATHLLVSTAADTARLTVADGLSHSVKSLDKLLGTVIKDGAGALTLGVGGVLEGTVVVEEGTLAFSADDGCTLGKLTIRSGARFDVPASGILCDVLDVEDGSIIGGAGVLTYRALAGGTMPGVIIRESAIIREAYPEPADFSVRVNGDYATYTEGDSAILIIPSNTTICVKGSGSVDAMLVAGGGGGGGDRGGGGGGGGVIITNELAVSDGLFGVTIGEGGRAGSVRTVRLAGGKGGDSCLLGLTAIGGGGGGIRGAGSSGGSGGGGGGSYFYNGGSTTAGGAGTPGQGCAGGASTNRNTSAQGGETGNSAAGGGGGAGGPGQNAPALGYSGAGGDGVECPFWKGHWFAGGGGGGNGASHRAAGGKGGGGQGGIATDADYKDHDGDVGKAEDGQPLTGGGGGGGGCSGESKFSKCGAGGSGVLLLRVPLSAVIDGKKVYDDPIATGGEVRRRKGHAVHTFTQDGTFEVPEDILADVLVVGGGGGGGTHGGGGGGGGGVVVISNFFFRAGSYPITVGAGGEGGLASAGADGGASVIVNPFLPVVSVAALGGGRGGMRANLPTVGGSGGGAGARYYYDAKVGRTDGAAGTDGQGFGGGASTNDTRVGTTAGDWKVSAGGGGGGAGEPGADGVCTGGVGCGGDGGNGIWCDFSGKNVCYGGGGGGGSSKYVDSAPFFLASGGEGGGGHGGAAENNGGKVSGKNGEAGTDGKGGGGGGGGMAGDDGGTGGKGGCGCVIIRYAVQPTGMMMIVR